MCINRKYANGKCRVGTALILTLCMIAVCVCTGCGQVSEGIGEETATVMFTDSCGREVMIPADIERVAPSGAVATMIINSIAPELLCGVSGEPAEEDRKYYSEEYSALPAFGQFYGSKATLNMEALLDSGAEIIIDIGRMRDSTAEDMDMITEQTGLPAVFIEANLDTYADAYRTLGTLLGMPDEGEARAQFIEKTLAMASEKRAEIPEDGVLSVMYSIGVSGLDCNAKGSEQARVIEFIGAENAIVVPEGEVSNKGGGNTVSLEEVYNCDPDVIIMTGEGPIAALAEDSSWNSLSAVKTQRFYEVPMHPYNWLGNPPSVNSYLGIWWLGQVVYPTIYNDYSIFDVAREFYSLFYHYEISDDELSEMLAGSVVTVN